MKRHFVKFLGIICITIFVVALMQTTAFALTEGDYEFTVSDGKATITAYGGAGGNVVIPSTLGGYPVVAIGVDAFKYKTNVTGVTVPEGVKSMGVRAFFGCSNIETVTLPSTLESVGGDAFQLCNKTNRVNISDIAAWCGISFANDSSNPLGRGATFDKLYVGGQLIHELVIPEGVTSVGKNAFYRCNGLTGVTLPSTLESIGESAFACCSSLTEIAIPEGVTSIGYSAFNNCTSLTEIAIPEGVTSIEISAFNNCTSLHSVTLPSTLESIENYTFYGCTSLASVTLPSTLESIGNSAFHECTSLESITLPSTLESIGNSAFHSCTALLEIVIPEGVTSFGDHAFANCSSLADIYFLGTSAEWSVVTKGNSWNSGCPAGDNVHIAYTYTVSEDKATITAYDGLGGDVVIPSTLGGYPVVAIGEEAFNDKTNVTGVTVPEGVKSIGVRAFFGCSNIETVTLPSTLESVGGDAFQLCNKTNRVNISDIAAWCGISFANDASTPLGRGATFDKLYVGGQLIHELVIPEGVTSVGKNAFYRCNGLTGVTLPSTLESIGEYAFRDCTSLTEIAIPEGVTSIVDGAFYNCSSLHSVTLPSTLESIENYTFYNCTSLASVTLPSTLESIGDSAFYNCTSLASVTLPSTLESIGKSAFYHCTSLASVTLPSTLESIGDSAFYHCTSLADIYFLGTSAEWSVVTKGNSWNSGCPAGDNIHIVYTYTVSESKATITAYDGAGGDVVIPSTLGGYPVVAIGEEAFRDKTNVTGVTVPEGVTSIGKNAFYNCSSLETVTLPSTLESVGNSAFHLCNKTNRVNISDIAAWCGISFANDASNPLTRGTTYSTTFDKLYVGGQLIHELVIPEGVASIEKYAFARCEGLTSVTLPSTLESIGEYAFDSCKSLSEITIPEGVTSIGYSAFEICTSLQSVTLPSTLESIGGYAFSYCTSLADIYFLGTSAKWNAVTKENYWNFNCPGGNNVHIAYTYTVSDGKATITAYDGFGGNVVITSTLDGYPVVAIGDDAFLNKTNVTGVTVPEGVKSIGSGAFFGCSNLETVTLPSTLESVGDDAFQLCNKTNRVNISDIAAWCGISFANDASNPLARGATYDKLYVGGQLIHELVIPEGVTSVGKIAFYRCEGLTGVTLPSTLESIGEYAFERCISLSEIAIPEGVTSIGYSAFYYCTSLASVTLPSTLESIGDSAFEGCTSLSQITVPDGVTSIGISAFGGCASLQSVTLSSVLESIGEYAFNSCKGLTSVTLPSTLESIGDSAFAGCTSLADIYFLGTSTEWNAVTKGSGWDLGCSYYFKITFIKCTVAASVVPDAYGTVTGGGDYEKNTEVTVKATPETGYRFVNWTVGGNVVSTDAEYKFTPSDDIELVANFDFLKYTVTFENHDGTILQSGGVEFGTKPTYGGKTPTRPSYNDKEYVFVGWSPKIENVTGEATYTAMFGIATTDKCSECGKTLYVDPDEITATHHGLYCCNTDCTEYKVAHEVAHGGGTATCKHNAICSVCGVGYGEIDPDNHSAGDAVKENVSVTTCLTEGSWELVTYCAECGAELSRIEVREEPLGHKFGEWTVTKPASCTVNGVETRVCANDPNHTETREIAETGHEFGEWDVTVAPTESKEGVEKRVCSKCGEEETRPILKLDHSHKMIHYEAVAPTETEEGYKEYYLCSVCGKWYEDAEGKKEIKDHGSIVIPALGKPDPIVYGFKVTPKTEWKSGSGDDFVLVSSADFSKFVGAKIDGTFLDGSHFTAVEGSTKVAFKAEYLETLAAGEHTLTIVSEDGEASATVNFVSDPVAPEQPTKTAPVVWIVIALAAAAFTAAVVVIVIKKKKK